MLTDKPRQIVRGALRRVGVVDDTPLPPAWREVARPEQLPPPGDWMYWVFLGGRGAGKTRAGAEAVCERVESGLARRVGLIAPTAADTRDVIIEGESGLLAVYRRMGKRPPLYEPSKRRVTWANGSVATTFSADEPDRLNGPQHDLLWADEVGVWRYPAAWRMAQLGLRLGKHPQAFITTTPKRSKLVREIVGDPAAMLSRSTTYDNRSNLAEIFFREVVRQYEGTTLGRQELMAEMLEDVSGALWTTRIMETSRVGVAPPLRRVVIAIDPATTATEDSAETGVVAVGLGEDGRGYVLADLSLRGAPERWARAAVQAYHDLGADRIVYETNQGGDMVAHTLRMVDPNVLLKGVTASKGKATRAEPVSALYEQGRVCHVGVYPMLEDQMTGWVPGEGASPDRIDALVWAITDLMIQKRGGWVA